MNRISLILLFCVLVTIPVLGQKRSKNRTPVQSKSTSSVKLFENPKLVVGIVVDQMRYDYLTRFWNHYEEGGFKRLVNDGFNCKNNHYNYAPTSTGPGHSSIYTGTTPATHGIIGNSWYDKELDTIVYCAGDAKYTSIGTASTAGKMSPHRMTVTTLTDQLRLHTQMQGKVIAIAVKDRGAVLPGGHTANGAYWFHGADEGKWITSSFYRNELPQWVIDFNSSGIVEGYKKPWTTLKDINLYAESGPDNNAYEGLFEDETTPTFPHSTPNLLSKDRDFEILKYTPYGNSITTDFALAALEGESLGIDDITDFLAISYSSTDYIGHKYGVNSKEIQDTYLRLDRDLARLFAVLDAKVGVNAYTVFLSADHGAIQVPSYLKDQKIPGGYLETEYNSKGFNEFLKYNFGTTDVVKKMHYNQVFLDHSVIKNLDIEIQEAQEIIAYELLNKAPIDRVYTAYQMWQNEYTSGISHILQNGYHQKRSGDILYTLKPGYVNYPRTGSTHGSPQVYDTHVPLLFYGKGIKKGHTSTRTEIPDIAPTIAALLGIAFPNGTTGTPISKLLDE